MAHRFVLALAAIAVLSGCGGRPDKSSGVPFDLLRFEIELRVDSESREVDVKFSVRDTGGEGQGLFGPSDNRPVFDENSVLTVNLNEQPLELTVDTLDRSSLRGNASDVVLTSLTFEFNRSPTERMFYKMDLADDLFVNPPIDTERVRAGDQVTVGVSVQSRSGQIFDPSEGRFGQAEVRAHSITCVDTMGEVIEDELRFFNKRVVVQSGAIPIAESVDIEVSETLPAYASGGLTDGSITSCSVTLDALYRVVAARTSPLPEQNGFLLAVEEQPNSGKVSVGAILYVRRTVEVLP